MAARSRSKAGRAKRSPKRVTHGGPAITAPPAVAYNEALTAHLTRDRMEAFQNALRLEADGTQSGVSGRRIKAMHDAMQESYALLDSSLVELELDPPIACKSGCIHCCYNQIALSEPEALVLGLHLLDTRDQQQLMDLEAKTRDLVESLNGKSWQDIGMVRHRLPCVFMENGNCSVYVARPFACRGWNSVDANMCLQSNLSEDAMTPIENHPIMRQVAESIQHGLLHGAKAMGLEVGYMLMSRSVLLLLEGGAEKGLLDCTCDWLSGRPFFGKKRAW